MRSERSRRANSSPSTCASSCCTRGRHVLDWLAESPYRRLNGSKPARSLGESLPGKDSRHFGSPISMLIDYLFQLFLQVWIVHGFEVLPGDRHQLSVLVDGFINFGALRSVICLCGLQVFN